jgi:hypothetical protein
MQAYHKGWKQIQDEKERKERIIKLKKIGLILLAVFVFILAMIIGGLTFPY